jgi:hypothetical protein
LNQLTETTIGCPYCGELIEVLLDAADIDQQYIEDCQVCCRPIVFFVSVNMNGDLSVTVYSEDEAF